MKKRAVVTLFLSGILAMSIMKTSFAQDIPVEKQSGEGQDITLNETNFPDENFRMAVAGMFDTDENGVLSEGEIVEAKELYLWDTVNDLKGIENLTSLEEFNCCECLGEEITSLSFSDNKALKILDCSFNEGLTSIDVSANENLEELHCYNTNIAAINISKNNKLVRLDCNSTKVSSLDVTKCPELFALNCGDTSVTSLDLSKNSKLYEVYVSNNAEFKSLDISKNPVMGQVRIDGTAITELDTSHNPELVALYMPNTNIKSIDLSHNPKMFEIYCYNSKIEKLDTSLFENLETIECYNTPLKELNISANKNLKGLDISDTQISNLDIGNNTNLRRLECENTPLKHLDISKCKELKTLNIRNTNIEEFKCFDISGMTKLEELYCSSAGVEKLTVGENQALCALSCEDNSLAGLNLSKLSQGALWLGNSVSPQKKNVSCELREQKQIVDMNALVDDIGKLSISEGEGYSYDAVSGIITLNEETDAVVEYTYDHGYAGVDPMSVQLNVHYHNDIKEKHIEKASFNKEGKTAGSYCTGCNSDIKSQETIEKVTAKLSTSENKYTGKTSKPSVIVQSGNSILKQGKDYTITYEGEFKNVGIYGVKVTLIGETYEGSQTLSYQITPNPSKIGKVKGSRKSLKLTWKKQTKEISGYQVQYSTKKSFKSGVKTKYIKRKSATSVTLKKLKAKKTYYVRIRSYKNVKLNGKTVKVYSKWSSLRKAKTK